MFLIRIGSDRFLFWFEADWFDMPFWSGGPLVGPTISALSKDKLLRPLSRSLAESRQSRGVTGEGGHCLAVLS